MKPVLIAGITIVNLALISYSIAIFNQTRQKLMSRKVLTFLTVGVVFDITATICMVIGSGHFITLHGIIGYSSLTGMLIDTAFSYRLMREKGINAAVGAKFIRGSQVAYYYWVVAYITGAMIVMMK